MSFDHRDQGDDGHRCGLNEKNAPKPGEAGHRQKRDRPGNQDFGEVQRAKEGAAAPHRREQRRYKQNQHQQQQVQRLTGKIPNSTLRSSQAEKQTDESKHSGNLCERKDIQSGDPIFRAGTINHAEDRQPEIGATQRLSLYGLSIAFQHLSRTHCRPSFSPAAT